MLCVASPLGGRYVTSSTLERIARESALINSIKKLWNGIWPEERFKLCVFCVISILYCLTLVVIPILAYFSFILLKYIRTQDLDVLHTMKSRVKGLCVGIAMAAVVIIVSKGAVTKIEIDHSYAELEMINRELLMLDQEYSTLLQELEEQYPNIAAERKQSKDIRSFRSPTEVTLEEASFNYEKVKITADKLENEHNVRTRKMAVESRVDNLYYLFKVWSLNAVIIVLSTTLYYIAFNSLFLKPLLLNDNRWAERE